jgi:hypothetical protein
MCLPSRADLIGVFIIYPLFRLLSCLKPHCESWSNGN